MKITDLKTNHLSNPVGFHMDRAVLQWKVREFSGNRTISAVVRVSKESEMEQVFYEGTVCNKNFLTVPFELDNSMKYYWQVEVTDEFGNTAKSQVAWFETAKAEKKWKAKWITPENQNNRCLGKEIAVSQPIKSAVLSISAVGLYEVYIDGKKIGDEYLTPDFNDYDSFIQFQTYHVEEELKGEQHKIEIFLGNGWYKGRTIGGFTDRFNRYGDKYAAIAELRIIYVNGECQTIVTDESWKAGKSIICEDSIYDGEFVDATIKTELTDPVQLSELTYEKLEARRSIPVKQKKVLKPKKLILSPKKEVILDFGQNIAGWVKFYNRLPAEKKCRLTMAEILQDGCFYHENMRTAKTEFKYISNGENEWIRPHFTYYGFRYVKLEGFGECINLEDFQAEVLFSDMQETGKVETGNAKVNKLIENIFWSQRGNFIDVPTDCPQRDERLGWTGDAQIFSGTAAFNMDVEAFFEKYMYDLRQEQKKWNGKVPLVIPNISFDGQTSAAWGDAATIIPWTMYMMYGDLGVLREQYPAMKEWTDYIRSRDLKFGREYLWEMDNHFGDWLSLDAKPGVQTGGTDMSLIATAYYYHSASLTAKAADVLGMEEDAEKYRILSENIRKNFQKEFMSENGRLCEDTQTAHAIVLCFGLYETEEQAERLADRLENIILENKGLLNTGFVGTHYLCHALSKSGKGRLAYDLLLNEKYPGWIYSVSLGATTIWERWNSVLRDGHMNPEGMNSLNHYAYGSILEWVYEYAAGIRPLTAGWKRFLIQPEPDRRLKKLEAVYDCPYGVIKSGWEYTENQKLKIYVEIPFDTEAVLRLPGEKEHTVKAGRYDYVISAPKDKKDYNGETELKELLADSEAVEVIRKTAPGLLEIPEPFQNGSLKEKMLNIFSGYTRREYCLLISKLKELTNTD